MVDDTTSALDAGSAPDQAARAPAPGRPNQTIPQSAAALGYLGAIPFIIATTALWFQGMGGMVGPELASTILKLEIAMGIILLTFLGGIRWGLAISSEEGSGFTPLVIAVLASWVALGAALVPDPRIKIGILIAGLLWLLWSDIRATGKAQAPAWYPGLRIPLTALVTLSFAFTLAHLFLRGVPDA